MEIASIPQIMDSVAQDCLSPPPVFISISNASCYLHFWPNGYKSEVLMITPASGLINLLDQVKWLLKLVYLLDYHFFFKDITQEQQDRRDTLVRVCEQRLTRPHEARHSPRPSMCSPTREFLKNPSLYRFLSIINSMFSLLWKKGGGAERSKLPWFGLSGDQRHPRSPSSRVTLLAQMTFLSLEKFQRI